MRLIGFYQVTFLTRTHIDTFGRNRKRHCESQRVRRSLVDATRWHRETRRPRFSFFLFTCQRTGSQNRQNTNLRENYADPGYSRTSASPCQEDQLAEQMAEAGAAAVSEAYIGPAPSTCQQTQSEKLHEARNDGVRGGAKPRKRWLSGRCEMRRPVRRTKPAKVFPGTVGCGRDRVAAWGYTSLAGGAPGEGRTRLDGKRAARHEGAAGPPSPPAGPSPGRWRTGPAGRGVPGRQGTRCGQSEIRMTTRPSIAPCRMRSKMALTSSRAAQLKWLATLPSPANCRASTRS